MARRNVAQDLGWSEYAAALGVLIHQRRMELGLSQEAVAYRAKITRYTYQKYESGLSVSGHAANPTIRTLLALSQVLELPLTALLPSEAPDLRAR